MVLVSHTHKFIYIKNVKTAGTTCQVIFSKYCHKDDISKHIEERTKGDPRKHPKNPENGEINTNEGYISNHGFFTNNDILPGMFAQHSRSILIKDKFSEYFDKYFKFCIVRNPYDRIVSRFNWDKKVNEISINMTFKEYKK